MPTPSRGHGTQNYFAGLVTHATAKNGVALSGAALSVNQLQAVDRSPAKYHFSNC